MLPPVLLSPQKTVCVRTRKHRFAFRSFSPLVSVLSCLRLSHVLLVDVGVPSFPCTVPSRPLLHAVAVPVGPVGQAAFPPLSRPCCLPLLSSAQSVDVQYIYIERCACVHTLMYVWAFMFCAGIYLCELFQRVCAYVYVCACVCVGHLLVPPSPSSPFFLLMHACRVGILLPRRCRHDAPLLYLRLFSLLPFPLILSLAFIHASLSFLSLCSSHARSMSE